MELSKVDIKESIVYTLEKKGNYSCKEDRLPNEVLKYLALPLRGKKREEFCKELRVASGQLKRANVIISYSTPMNDRLRLTKNYKNAFLKLQKKWMHDAKRDTMPTVDKSITMIDDESTTNQMPLFTVITDNNFIDHDFHKVDIPDLPDLEEEDNDQDDHIIPEEYDQDEETINLLDSLTNSEISENPNRNIKNSPDEKEQMDTNFDVLDILNRSLDGTPFITVERSFNELIVYAEAMDESITAYISHGALDNLLRVKTYLPFVENAAINLLDLSGKMEFNSAIGTTSISGKKNYIVKNSLIVSSKMKSQLKQIIIQTLSDAFKAIKIIKNS